MSFFGQCSNATLRYDYSHGRKTRDVMKKIALNDYSPGRTRDKKWDKNRNFCVMVYHP